MNERLKLTTECRPNEEEVVLCCTNKGNIYCGVVNYWGEKITFSMFVNERETDVTTPISNIRWWQPFPLTKEELYLGTAQIN
jgi:hypothetical protein